MSRLIVTIPGKINSALNPNARLHWRPIAEAKATAKQMATLYTKQAAHRMDTTGIDTATYHVERGKGKGEKHMDQDNLAASCKAHLDGIALALGVDDRHWQIGTVGQVRDPEGIGYLTITLEWQSDANEDAA